METEQMATVAQTDNIFVFNEVFDNANKKDTTNIQEMVKKAFELGRMWQIDVDWLDTNEISKEERANRIQNGNKRIRRFEKRYGYKLS